MLNRRRFAGLTAAAIAAPSMLASRALGANWPLRNVRIVVPFPPGGSTDITARLVGNRLQEVWGQTVVIENKPGAGGNIASDMVARSDPDGYTVFIVGPGLATNQFLYPSLSYDPVGDFAPVTLLITQPNVMCVPNSKPAKSVREFIAYCNDNRGKVTYASSGNGTTLHLSGELFKRLANVEMTHIPYRGGALAINDLLPGRVDVSFDNMPSIMSCQGRRGARARRDDQGARPGRAGFADDRGSRRARLRCFELVRLLRAGEDAPGDHCQAQRRHQRRAGARLRQAALRRPRRHPARHHAGRTRRLPEIGNRQMGPRDPRRPDQGGELSGTVLLHLSRLRGGRVGALSTRSVRLVATHPLSPATGRGSASARNSVCFQ
jgi:hypothetical protein